LRRFEGKEAPKMRKMPLIRVHRARSRLAWQTGASETGGPVFIRLPNLSNLPNEIFFALILSGWLITIPDLYLTADSRGFTQTAIE
jgi:hypothetical protein